MGMRDPWRHSSADGGGEIPQRFGTPRYYDPDSSTWKNHFFGLDSSSDPAFSSGVHNVFYSDSSPTSALLGKETMTIFVNGVQDGTSSFVYEFELKLTQEV